MSFEEYLKMSAGKVEKELDKILNKFLEDTKKTNPKLVPFAKEFIKSCKGGKRIRGVLVGLGYEMTQSVILSETKDPLRMQDSNKLRDSSPSAQNDKKGVQNDIIKIGAGFEILHTSLLIHDDIIDKSLKRRDKPSLYASLGNNHYGISQAITLGDIGLYLPIKIITETKFKDEVKLKTLNYFSQILINTGWGQVADISKDKNKDFVNLYKTAKYTISGPLQIGAILAGADKNLIKNLGIFGDNLGIAYQLQDDILDLEVKDVEKARAKALEYTLKAKKLISEITKDEKMKQLLEEMCNYLVERSR